MDTTNMNPEMNAPGTGAVPQTPVTEPATLADVFKPEPTQAPTAPITEPAQQPLKEPGYLERKRSEWEAARKPEMDALHAEVATLREYVINQEADKLIASGKVSDREIALAYLRSKEGMPVADNTPAKNVPQRDEQGRFVSSNSVQAGGTPPEAIQQRAQTLIAQADRLSRVSGVDLMGLYNTDPNVRQKIVSGEWDFIDALESVKAAPVAPAPVRSHNGLGMGGMNFRSMTDDQFAKVNEMLDGGKTIDMRR